MQDVSGALVAKMHARHPHLYGDGVRRSWESLKAERKPRASIDEGIPRGLPALHRAHRLQDRAAGAGFDWPDARGPLDKIHEEAREVAAHLDADGVVTNPDALEDELGDLLFAVVNFCRKTGVHAALALDKANRKFVDRYDAMERLAKERGLDFNALTLHEQDQLWNVIKLRQQQE
jgi:MazG family protein